MDGRIFFGLILFLFVAAIVAIPICRWVALRRIAKLQEEINRKVCPIVEQKIARGEFFTDRVLILKDNATYKAGEEYRQKIYADTQRKIFGLPDYKTGQVYFIPFEDFSGYEVYTDGGTQINGGGYVYKGSGWSGVISRDLCRTLRLIIKINRFELPQISYDCVSGIKRGINKSSRAYREIMAALQEATAFLEVIRQKKE